MNRDTTPYSSRQKDLLITILFSTVLLYITFSYVVMKINAEGAHDFQAHVLSLLPLFRGSTWWKGWLAAPHCLWHLTTLVFFELLKLPLDASAAAATCVYTLFYYLVLLWVIKRFTGRDGAPLSALACNGTAFAFYFVQSLYVYWFDAGERYLGGFSMNPLHNPTQLCVRGFALLAFCIVADLLGSLSGESYVPVFFDVRTSKRKYRIILAVLLFLSTVMKPTFAEVFIPAVAFYMLGVWLWRLRTKQQPGAYFKECLLMLVCALPALFYMLLQYILFFFLGGSYNDDGGMIVTSAFEVWHLFTDNVMLSVLLGMAFPIYMFVIDPGYWFKTVSGKLSLLAYGFGFLMASFLGEAGARMDHANFIWPYMSGMLLVWLTATLRMLTLLKKPENNRKQTVLLNIGLVLFLLHLLFGFLFLAAEFKGL